MKKLYRDFDDFWANSRLTDIVGLSKDDMEAIWDDLTPTINAGRHDWEQFLIEEAKRQKEEYILRIKHLHSYITHFDLEKVTGIGFHRWLLNKKRKEG